MQHLSSKEPRLIVGGGFAPILSESIIQGKLQLLSIKKRSMAKIELCFFFIFYFFPRKVFIFHR